MRFETRRNTPSLVREGTALLAALLVLLWLGANFPLEARTLPQEVRELESSAADLREGLEFYRRGQYADAARVFEKYLEVHPDSLPTRKLLAKCYLSFGKPELALDQLRLVTARLPQDEDARKELARAVRMLERIRAEQARKPKPEEIQRWFAQAEKAIRAKDLARAEILLERVLVERPAWEPALLRMAEIYNATRRFQRAASLYEKLLRLGGARSDEWQLRLARTLAWAERYEDSLRSFQAYLKRNPQDFSAHFDAAEVFRWAGQPERAISHYRTALQAKSTAQAARMGLALSYQALDRHEEALRVLDKILRDDPEDKAALQARAHSLRMHGQELKRRAVVAQQQEDYPQAIRWLEEYAAAHPDDMENVHHLARLCSWAGEWDASRRYYERYLEHRPDDSAARLALADLLSWQGEFASARSTYEQVLEAEPRNAQALAGIIRTLQWAGELAGAESYVRRLQEVEPGNPLVQEARAQLADLHRHEMRARAERLQESGEFSKAIDAYQEYLAAYGPNRELELRIPRLYSWNRQYARAVQEYRAYLLRYPDASGARLELAEVQRWSSDYPGALENYAAVLAEDPSNHRALLGWAEALYATRLDLFEVRRAYQDVLKQEADDAFAASRLHEINLRLRPQGLLRARSLFDSDDLQQVIVEPQAVFLLPENFRLIPRLRISQTRQPRLLQGTTPAITALNQRIGELGSNLDEGRAGLRVERHRRWGVWGAEADLGVFSDDRVSFTFAGDITAQVSEQGQFYTRYEHAEAGFELNTLASLVAGIQSDSWRARYRYKFPREFDFSSGYHVAYFSDSDSFGFDDNLRHAADARLTYRRFRIFQPAYSYSVSHFRSESPLYFSPGLYQAHRFEYLVQVGRRPLVFLANGSLGLGRIDGVNTFEVTLAPQLTLRQGNWEIDLGYRFGRSRASGLGNSLYRVHGVFLSVRFPFPVGRE